MNKNNCNDIAKAINQLRLGLTREKEQLDVMDNIYGEILKALHDRGLVGGEE